MPPDTEIVSLIPALRAFARSFCRSPFDADDLVQETLVKALAKIDQFKDGTSLKSWLFTIMRNTFYTRIRQARREAPGDEDCASARPAVDAPQDWSARGHEIARAIERLAPEQREVIVLIGVLGASYEEAAEVCDCAVGTIKSRLSRARVKLLHELGEQSGESTIETAEQHPVACLPRRN